MGQMTNALFMLSEDKQTVTQVYWSLGSRLWSFSEGFLPPHPPPQTTLVEAGLQFRMQRLMACCD